jgi:hypothetical protein
VGLTKRQASGLCDRVRVDISIVKGGEGARDRTWMTLSDGTTRQIAVAVIHDLPHLVVESLFQVDDGLWGVLAAGGFAPANEAVTMRSTGRAKVKLVTDAPFDDLARENWMGHRVAKAVTNAVVNRWQEGPDSAEGVRVRLHLHAAQPAATQPARDDSEYTRRVAGHLARVDDATIELAIRGVGKLYARWAATPVGATLRLRWPLDREFFLSR